MVASSHAPQVTTAVSSWARVSMAVVGESSSAR
jgi:hypothetical protein